MPLGTRVLVCEDDPALSRAAFEKWFGEDLAQRQQWQGGAALRRLEVDGQVCRTLRELSNSLDEAQEARSLPDLVLIDDRLQPERGGDPVRSALYAVQLIVSKFGADGPKSVLHTSEPTVNDIWTFCALGGHNVIDKFRPHERARILWETIDGHRWEPPQLLPTDVTIADANGRLLPYMEHSHWKYNARRDLPDLAADPDGNVDNRLDQCKRRLAGAFGLDNKWAEAREILAAAHAHGLVWVPLGARHLLPRDHPEHRPTAFKHRTPGASQM